MPYDTGVLWITPQELHAAVHNKTVYLDNFDNAPLGKYYLGIDWGSSESEGNANTVVTVLLKRAGVFSVVYIRKFAAGEGDFDFQIEQILRIASRLGASAIGADWGFGAYQNQKIRKMAKCKVLEVQYTSQKQFVQFSARTRRWHIDRTQAMDWLKMNIVENGTVKFPKMESIKHVEKEFYALERVENLAMGKITYEHDLRNPDDAIHSLFYALFAGGQAI